MEQPEPPAPSSNKTHIWPSQFIVDWDFYFVPDDSDVPPYTPLPKTPYNVTKGKTFYFNNEGKFWWLKSLLLSYRVRCFQLLASAIWERTTTSTASQYLELLFQWALAISTRALSWMYAKSCCGSLLLSYSFLGMLGGDNRHLLCDNLRGQTPPYSGVLYHWTPLPRPSSGLCISHAGTLVWEGGRHYGRLECHLGRVSQPTYTVLFLSVVADVMSFVCLC